MLSLALMSPTRAASALAAFVVAVLLVIASLGLLVAALHLTLTPELGGALASLLTALFCLLLAALAVLLSVRLQATDAKRRLSAEAVAGDAAGQLVAWTRQNPREAALTAALLGFSLAAMPELRQALIDVAAAAAPRRPSETG